MASELQLTSDPQVRRFCDTGQFNGKFYVCALFIDHMGGSEQTYYLHNDGQWRKSTRQGEDNFTGYFSTQGQAFTAMTEAIARIRKNNN